ncbi:MAG: hypothetical protein H0V01_00530 [Bacteroidetes bacterium]|nr:hypothetical protein [Bacteroidota bacterium]HET6245638.1 hypothetical protein [Bacteroidia bacterium]
MNNFIFSSAKSLFVPSNSCKQINSVTCFPGKHFRKATTGFNSAFVVLMLMLSFSSCISSKKHMDRGQYDIAITKSVKKLKKNRNNEKHMLILEKSYNLANERDKERVGFLKLEGNPDIWDDVYQSFLSLKGRQARVKPVMPLKVPSTGRVISFDFVNYDEEIINAKRKAAEFYYVRGTLLLENGSKENARSAYNDFKNVQKFFSDYKDLNQQINKALDIGTSHVAFKMQNASGIPLPLAFEEDLTKISLNDLNGQWVKFHTIIEKNAFYDYTVKVNIRMIDISPEGLKEVHFIETKDVQDGFQYLLDKNGNVMKDSLGNDMKAPKYKTITCNLIETQQKKTARIAGTIDFIDNHTGQLLKSDPIASDVFFDHISLIAIGDLNALKPETKKMIGIKPMPFPPNPEMIMQCGNIMKGMTKNILVNNQRLLN